MVPVVVVRLADHSCVEALYSGSLVCWTLYVRLAPEDNFTAMATPKFPFGIRLIFSHGEKPAALRVTR
jgi:hypothetical protein